MKTPPGSRLAPIVILIATLLAQGLVACAPTPKPSTPESPPAHTPKPSTPEPSPESAFEGTTISFACSERYLRHYGTLANDFSQSHPDIRVQVRPTSEIANLKESVCARFQQLVSGVDTFVQSDWMVNEDLERGYLLNLNPFVEHGFSPMDQGFEAFVYAHGGSLADESFSPPIPTLDDPPTVEASQQYVDLALKYGVMPNPAEMDWDAIYELERQGQVAMWSNYPVQWEDIRAASEFNVGVVPFPEAKAAANPGYAYGYFISGGTAHPRECWEWIKYLSHQPSPGLWSDLPVLRSEIADPTYREKVGEEAAEAFSYALENGVSPSAYLFVGFYYQAVDKALAETKRVEEALSDAQQEALGWAEKLREEFATAPEPFAVPPLVPEREGVTITFQPFGWGTPLALFAYEEMAQAFNELHPDVEIKMERLDTSEGLRLARTAASADCFLWIASVSPEEGEEHLLNLQPLLDTDPDFTLDDFYPMTLEAWQWEGELWGLPAYISPYVISYNRDLFDEAGVEYPGTDWDWDEFLAKAIKLTKGEGEDKQYGFTAVSGDSIPLCKWRFAG